MSEIALEFSPVMLIDSSYAVSKHSGHLNIRHRECSSGNVLLVHLPQRGRIQNPCFAQWFTLALIALHMQQAFNK